MFTHPDRNYSVSTNRETTEVEVFATAKCAIAEELIRKRGDTISRSILFRERLSPEAKAAAVRELLAARELSGTLIHKLTPEQIETVGLVQAMYLEVDREVITEANHDTGDICDSDGAMAVTYDMNQNDEAPWMTDEWIEQICEYVEELAVHGEIG